MTSEEEDKIVLKVIERVLNLMPEVIGNLMATHDSNNKIKDAFYKKYPEFKSHTEIVRSLVEQSEGKALNQDYEKILEDAVPKIREQIRIKSSLDVKNVASKDSLSLKLDTNTNGEL